MKFKLLIPGKTLVEADVDAVTLPGGGGQLTPMSGHDLLLTPLREGLIYFRSVEKDAAGERQEYRISGGVAEILKDSLTVFTMDASRESRVTSHE